MSAQNEFPHPYYSRKLMVICRCNGACLSNFLIYQDGFLNKSQIEGFFGQLESCFYRDVSKKLILGTFTSSSLFSNSSNLTGKISNMLFHCRMQCCFFFWRGCPKKPQKWFQGTFKPLNTTMKTAMEKKIHPRPWKKQLKFDHSQLNNVFCMTEASSIISSVAQARITKNCDRHIHCSSLITIHYYGQEKNYNVVFIP